MDTQRNDLLEEILNRLDMTNNQEHNMNRIMERLNTLQNIMERQSKKQNFLEEKLDDIGSIVREMYQQQREAKEETTVKTAIQHGAQQEAKEETTVRTAIQHGAQQGNTIEPSFGEKQRLSSDISEKQIQAIRDLEIKIEQLNTSATNLSRDIETTILTTNKQFTIDLENTIGNRLTEMNLISKGHSFSVNQTVESNLDKLLETLQSDIQTNTQLVVKVSDEQSHRIISAADSLKVDLRHLIQTEGGNINKCTMALGNVSSLINSLASSLDGKTTTLIKEIDKSNASMSSGHSTVKKHLEQLTTDLKDYIYKTKREIFAVTEKEAQIVRDRIQGPLPSQGKYTFDFYVNNFKTLVRSGKEVESLPWHINEMRSCVTGQVIMKRNGEINVWLNHGRHPHEVGLQPKPRKLLKFKATICDISEKKLPPVYLGEETGSFDQASIKTNRGWGHQVGVISCDELIQKGYGEKEGYLNGALLIRYEVEVLSGCQALLFSVLPP